jgi:hypothetical protein
MLFLSGPKAGAIGNDEIAMLRMETAHGSQSNERWKYIARISGAVDGNSFG